MSYTPTLVFKRCRDPVSHSGDEGICFAVGMNEQGSAPVPFDWCSWPCVLLSLGSGRCASRNRRGSALEFARANVLTLALQRPF